MERGRPVHMEREAGIATAGAVLLIYEAGNTSAITLAADERIYITDIHLFNPHIATRILTIAADAIAAGEIVMVVSLVTKTTKLIKLKTPFLCPEGVTPKLFSNDIGAARCYAQGFITK